MILQRAAGLLFLRLFVEIPAQLPALDDERCATNVLALLITYPQSMGVVPPGRASHMAAQSRRYAKLHCDERRT